MRDGRRRRRRVVGAADALSCKDPGGGNNINIEKAVGSGVVGGAVQRIV